MAEHSTARGPADGSYALQAIQNTNKTGQTAWAFYCSLAISGVSEERTSLAF